MHTYRLRLLLSFFVFSLPLFFLSAARATPPAPHVGGDHSFAVRLEKGLLTVDAKDVTLGFLLEEIRKKVKIKVSFGTDLRHQKVTVHFKNLTIEEGLKTILRGAGIENHAVVYRKSKGGENQWVVEEILLAPQGKMAVITEEAVEFFGNDNKVKKRIDLSNQSEGRHWFDVTMSNNKKYIAINDIQGDNVEFVDSSQLTILNEDGDELWRINYGSAETAIPSPNGGYVVKYGILENSALLNRDGLVREMEGDETICMGFSNEGDYFVMGLRSREVLDVVIMDEQGNKLGQSNGIVQGEDADNCEIEISNKDIITVKTNLPDFKVHRLNKRGTILSNK